MSSPNVIVPLLVVGVVAVAGMWIYNWWSGEPEREPQRYGYHHDSFYYNNDYNDNDDDDDDDDDDESDARLHYTNPYRNHDDQKRLYSTKAQAEAAIRELRQRGRPGADRLNIYYSRERRGFLVGNRKYG